MYLWFVVLLLFYRPAILALRSSEAFTCTAPSVLLRQQWPRVIRNRRSDVEKIPVLVPFVVEDIPAGIFCAP